LNDFEKSSEGPNSSYRMSAEWVAGSVELKDCNECDSAEKPLFLKIQDIKND
jgi:hypothetical protein